MKMVKAYKFTKQNPNNNDNVDIYYTLNSSESYGDGFNITKDEVNVEISDGYEISRNKNLDKMIFNIGSRRGMSLHTAMRINIARVVTVDEVIKYNNDNTKAQWDLFGGIGLIGLALYALLSGLVFILGKCASAVK